MIRKECLLGSRRKSCIRSERMNSKNPRVLLLYNTCWAREKIIVKERYNSGNSRACSPLEVQPTFRAVFRACQRFCSRFVATAYAVTRSSECSLGASFLYNRWPLGELSLTMPASHPNSSLSRRQEMDLRNFRRNRKWRAFFKYRKRSCLIFLPLRKAPSWLSSKSSLRLFFCNYRLQPCLLATWSSSVAQG
jgi:hypothetical protein